MCKRGGCERVFEGFPPILVRTLYLEFFEKSQVDRL